VLETMMFNRLNQHLNINKIIVPDQYGFRRGINIENAIFSLTNTILSSLNKKQVVAGLFSDLSKAFDSVNHSVLLQKLSYYGVRGIYLNWFESYLTNRRQKVIISTHGGNYSSNWETANSEVPQDSVLGPLLFVIYINDFPYIIHQIAKPIIYADDTSILVHAANVMELQVKISDSIYHINEWLLVNGLTLNLEKMNIIKFSSKKSKEEHTHFRYSNIIKETCSLKFLGLELDKFLNWRNHIDKLLLKLSSACFAIRSMSSHCNITTIKMVYCAYFHSLLEYGIAFWGNSNESVKVFKLQKRVIRLMTGSNVRTSCRPLFPLLGIMTLPSQYIFSMVRFLSRNLEFYTFNSTIHNYKK